MHWSFLSVTVVKTVVRGGYDMWHVNVDQNLINLFQLSGADTMLSTSEHKVSQPSFSQNRSSTSTGLDMDKTEVGLSYSAPNTATYQPSSYQSQKSGGTGYQQASSYSSPNYSSTQVLKTVQH
jgi:hypothetical protein